MEIIRTALAQAVIGAAIEVHSALGPGLLESAYDRCLAHEFQLRGIRFVRQLRLPIDYKGISISYGYRVDFVIEDTLVIELKTVERNNADSPEPSAPRRHPLRNPRAQIRGRHEREREQ